MSKFNTNKTGLQEKIFDGRKFYIDVETGEVIEPLRDDKFNWQERKRSTLRLADAYAAAKMAKHQERLRTCVTWMEYLTMRKGDQRQLHGINACQQRLCPLCGARKAHVIAKRLVQVLAKAQADHPDTQLLFLTLSPRNVKAEHLRDALDQLTKAWYLLCHRRPVQRAVKGWYRAIEITRNRDKDTYHPHIHAILMVENGYFKRANGLYITQERWLDMWQRSLRCDYKPTVHIERTHGKDGAADSAASAALEAAKYATKSEDYIGADMSIEESAQVVATLTTALVRKRMTALGGWMQEAARQLDLNLDDTTEQDLVHADDDANAQLTLETAEMLEYYGWHFGVGDHVLIERTPNPAYRSEGSDDESGGGSQ